MASTPSHLDHVRNDLAYADILANWDAAFYAKFTRTLRPSTPGARPGGGRPRGWARIRRGGLFRPMHAAYPARRPSRRVRQS